jgi:hypothetical protein
LELDRGMARRIIGKNLKFGIVLNLENPLRSTNKN